MASFCKDAPHTPKQQTAFLSRRGVIDELTASVLERAIRKRNQVEHGYTTPDLETAEDVVELLRRSIAAIRIKADPSNGPFIYGVFLYAISGGAEGIRAEFHGWQQPLVVFSRFEPRPWIGLVMPSSESRATVRRAFLTDVTTEELLQILSLAEQEYGQPSSASDLTACKVLGSAMGLVGGE